MGKRARAIRPRLDYVFADIETLSDLLSAQELFGLLDNLPPLFCALCAVIFHFSLIRLERRRYGARHQIRMGISLDEEFVRLHSDALLN